MVLWLASLLRLLDTSRASLRNIVSLHRWLPTGAPFVLTATLTAHFVISLRSVILAAFVAFKVVDDFGAHGRCLLCVFSIYLYWVGSILGKSGVYYAEGENLYTLKSYCACVNIHVQMFHTVSMSRCHTPWLALWSAEYMTLTHFDIIKGRLYKRNIYALYASTQANDRWWPAVYLMLSQLNLQFTVYPLPTVTTKINIYHVIILTPSLSKLFPGCLTSSLLKHRTCPSSIHAGCYTSRKHRIWSVFSQLCTSWSLSLTWSPCGILCTPRYQQPLYTWLVVYSKTSPVELTMCETCIVGG